MPFYPQPKKSKFWENEKKKKPGDIISLHRCTINDSHMYGMVPKIWSMTDRFFGHFGPFFALLPPNNPKNQNFEKMEKTPGDIIIYTCVP